MKQDGQSRGDRSVTPAKPFLRALAGETLARPPVWLMRQAGRYLPEYRAARARAGSFLDLCYNPELAAEVTLQPIRRYGFDAAILFSDILVVPHALGQALDYVEGEGPKLEPVTDAAAVARLSADRLHEVLGPVYETVGRVAAALPSETALIGFAGSPWTVATYMVEGGGSKEYAAVKRLAYGEPETFARLIDLLVEATSAYLLRQIEAGAEAVQLFDSWAGVLPEGEFERWVVAPTRRIVEAVRAGAPGVPVIGFPRGAGLLTERYLAGTGVDAVGLDTTVPPGWAARALQPKAAVQGNLDPVFLLTGGAPMLRAADAIVDALGRGPFVFNLGHGVLQKTPPEHVAALVRHLRGDAG
ncbi:uroporphyrinogen decarboxylase [Inquilinus limosus]|uniref:uroporphyrinogen decarboxylase n=1 Tax=Inquilinus limosus TaxID=171674 RepID=UPI000685C5DE